MEFSYRISEADYLAAAKMRRKAMSKSPFKMVVFWVFVVLCLFVIWSVISSAKLETVSSSHAQGHTVSDSANSADSTPPSGTAPGLFYNMGPLVVTVVVLSFFVYYYSYYNSAGPRRLYRKDPQMHGEITVNITPESFSSRSTAGATSTINWNLYERWIEKDNLILVAMYSRLFVILNIAGLSEAQRAELRGILSTALPKK
jgi:hypothetical protein